MEIPIELFISFFAGSIAVAVFGFIRDPQVPVMLTVSGVFILTLSVMTTGIVMEFFNGETESETVYYPLNSFGDLTTQLNNVNKAEIEFLSSPTSQLVGAKVQCMDVVLRKSGTPSGATLGISGMFDVNNTELFRFGAISPASVSTVFTIYTFCVDEGEEVTLASGDRIGFQYTSGTATDRLETRENSLNPFDGTVTFRQVYTTSWQSSSTTDFVMKLYDLNPESSNAVFEFTEFPKTIFALFGAILIFSSALMVYRP
jgi:hypothetical protein